MVVLLGDVIGIIGVSIIVVTYLLLQLQKISSQTLTYSILNIVGSIMILYSLIDNWNLASFVIQVFWIIISLFGIRNYYTSKKGSDVTKT